MFLERNVGVTGLPRSLNPRKAVAMAIFPIIVYFIAQRVRSMHDVACEFACALTMGANILKSISVESGSVNFQFVSPLVVCSWAFPLSSVCVSRFYFHSRCRNYVQLLFIMTAFKFELL